jgi:hypothetical protein
LYLYPDICRLLKNDASIFTLSHQQSTPRRSSNRPNYRLEAPKPTNFTTESSASPSNAEQFEYDTIESPQKFNSDFHVDWRIFNIALWSKCYCRYDQNYMPALREQQLSFEISCLQQDIKNASTKSRRQMTIDTFHSVRISAKKRKNSLCYNPFRLIMLIHGIRKRWILVYE